jgi:hypothetical protein
MSKMKAAIASVVLATAALMTATPAVAATKQLSTVNNGSVVDLSAAAMDIGTTLQSYGPGAGSFADTYFFDLVDGNSGDFEATDFIFNGQISTLGIDPLVASIYRLGSGTPSLLGQIVLGASNPSSMVTYALLAGSRYEIDVSGTVTGSVGGVYSLSVQPSQVTAPVPGPGGLAVAIGGAGLIIAMGARRKRRMNFAA